MEHKTKAWSKKPVPPIVGDPKPSGTDYFLLITLEIVFIPKDPHQKPVKRKHVEGDVSLDPSN